MHTRLAWSDVRLNMMTLAVHHLNPQQVPIIAAKQPLYAVVKQVEWS